MNKIIKIVTLLLLVCALILAYFYLSTQQNKRVKHATLPNNFNIGLVNKCRKVPTFIHKLKMRQPAIDSKQQGHSGGLLIRDMANQKHVWQHESWSQSGHIGAFDRDFVGNIFVTPMPYVSLKKNPPETQNQIYKIDAKTGQMSLFMQIDSDKTPNTRNPFGTMGLSFDCDTNSMYVSSLAGSEPLTEHGIIYQIDITNNKIISQLEQTDAIGVGVFNTLKGKRLYFGSARNPHIYSVLLDEQGKFSGSGKKRYEFSLAEIQGGNTTVAKKIQFNKNANKHQMIVKEIEFGFRLIAENNPNLKKYIFQYSPAQDKWVFVQAIYE
ncbi:MAG: hypothetical protein L3J53_03800 [Proteobacteria bacterium]|nr:hypothetical protein [Pseudomonadota bacterium]